MIGREPVFSTWYGRTQRVETIRLYKRIALQLQAHNFAKQTRIQTIQTDIVPLHPILHTYQISRQNIQPSLFYIFEFF